jgi:ketosteroid isomerase-like protein
MTESSDIVRNVLNLLQDGRVEAALGYIHDDFICVEADSMPYAGTYRGKAGFTKLIALLGTTWNEFGFQIHEIFGQGENVAVIETVWGTEAGQRWTMRVVELWKVRAGKVIEATPYYHDTAALAKLHRERADR